MTNPEKQAVKERLYEAALRYVDADEPDLVEATEALEAAATAFAATDSGFLEAATDLLGALAEIPGALRSVPAQRLQAVLVGMEEKRTLAVLSKMGGGA